ncbi:hypothetical protein DEO72_LG1g2670 [Vigna unguiculata]|uniref:Uncharacterized protein n=1 Tax=Vigna unguiculata TaxID=3917 RepID=A0A4D6KR66_VIGUN|nr:hypothetical protein DEO72_LG1g2670 [Vigna unguiculata]
MASSVAAVSAMVVRSSMDASATMAGAVETTMQRRRWLMALLQIRKCRNEASLFREVALVSMVSGDSRWLTPRGGTRS